MRHAAFAGTIGRPLRRAALARRATPSDQELSNQIAKAIAGDTTLSADGIKVSVEGGVITLACMVGKDADEARAERLAHLPGVSRIQEGHGQDRRIGHPTTQPHAYRRV